MNSIDDVLRCIGRVVMVLALCCAIGLHWIALQSLAWTAMVVQYSKCARLGQAIGRTVDGAHPCSLCHVVNKGTASEKKSGAQLPLSKIDIVCVARTFQLLPNGYHSTISRVIVPPMNSGILRPFRHRVHP